MTDRDAYVREIVRELAATHTSENARFLAERLLGAPDSLPHPIMRPRILETPDDVIHEIAHFALLESRKRFGWLCRDGRLLGCDDTAHERLLFHLGLDTAAVETAGWVRISADRVQARRKPSQAQHAALRVLGRWLDDDPRTLRPPAPDDTLGDDIALPPARIPTTT